YGHPSGPPRETSQSHDGPPRMPLSTAATGPGALLLLGPVPGNGSACSRFGGWTPHPWSTLFSKDESLAVSLHWLHRPYGPRRIVERAVLQHRDQHAQETISERP